MLDEYFVYFTRKYMTNASDDNEKQRILFTFDVDFKTLKANFKFC